MAAALRVLGTRMQRKSIAAQFAADTALGARQIRVVASTPAVDRTGDSVDPSGVDLKNYLANPVVLRDHDQTQIVGKAQIIHINGRLEAVVTFDPEGVSPEADKAYAQAKAGSLAAVSIGFRVLEAAPNSSGGYRISKWELLELSLVAIPANPETLVICKAFDGDARPKVGASCGLDIAEGEWDSAKAAQSIFEHAGILTDEPDLGFIRKGFLVYDEAAKGEPTAYRFPFAAIIDGRLKASRGGLQAAAHAVKNSGLPDAVVAKAIAVVKHYEAKMPKLKIKSLYDVAQVARLLDMLGCVQVSAQYEAEFEGDGSAVPAMLGEACHKLGDALIAMTQEEVSELLAGMGGKDGLGDPPENLAKALTVLRTKAGRAFSAANSKSMREACKAILTGHNSIMDLIGDDDEDDDEEDAADEQAEQKAVVSSVTKAARAREIDMMRLSNPA